MAVELKLLLPNAKVDLAIFISGLKLLIGLKSSAALLYDGCSGEFFSVGDLVLFDGVAYPSVIKFATLFSASR